MGYIDCHCHLTAKEFDKDRSEVIEHAKKSNVESIIVVTEFASEFNPTLQMCSEYPGFLYACLGVHPVQPVSLCLFKCFSLIKFGMPKTSDRAVFFNLFCIMDHFMQ